MSCIGIIHADGLLFYFKEMIGTILINCSMKRLIIAAISFDSNNQSMIIGYTV